MRFLLLALMIVLVGCTTKQDVLKQTPMLDRIYNGYYQAVAACTFNGIQTIDYVISPNIQFVPVPSQGYVEIQTTASGAYTGTIFGAITRLEDIDGLSFRVIVRATYVSSGNDAIKAITDCIEQQ